MIFPRGGTGCGSQQMWNTPQDSGESSSKFYLLESIQTHLKQHRGKTHQTTATTAFVQSDLNLSSSSPAKHLSTRLQIQTQSRAFLTPSWQPAVFTGAQSPNRRLKDIKTEVIFSRWCSGRRRRLTATRLRVRSRARGLACSPFVCMGSLWSAFDFLPSSKDMYCT